MQREFWEQQASRRRFLRAAGAAGGLAALTLAGIACLRPSPDQQRQIDLDATATAASGRGVTEQSVSKFDAETVRSLRQAVGILSVNYVVNGAEKALNATAWYVQLPAEQKGSRVVTAAHAFLNHDAGVSPQNSNFVSFDQPLLPNVPVAEFEGDLSGNISIPRAYRESVAAGRPDLAHDVAVFTIDDIGLTGPGQVVPFTLPFSPDYEFQANEELLVLGYPFELTGYYPGTGDIDPSKTTMSVALATVQDAQRGIVTVRSEEDRGASGSPVIACNRSGMHVVAGILSAGEPGDAHTNYVTRLPDLRAIV